MRHTTVSAVLTPRFRGVTHTGFRELSTHYVPSENQQPERSTVVTDFYTTRFRPNRSPGDNR